MGIFSSFFAKGKTDLSPLNSSQDSYGVDFLNTNLTQPDDWFIQAITGSATAAGMRVNALSALGVPTVFACVNAVSRSISSIPIHLYRRTPGGGKAVAVDHPLYSLMHDAPNEEMTSSTFRRAMQANATLRNSAYAMIVRNGLGQVVELHPIPNSEIKPERDPTGKLYYVVNGETIDPAKILHVKGLTFNGVSGMDNMSVARESIGLAMALQDHGSKFFVNSATPRIGIELQGPSGPDQIKKFKEAWDAANTGNANAHKTAVLAQAKFASVPQVDNRAGQFIEAKIYQDKCICQVFGVPQIKAGITDSAHFNNVEQENQNYVTDTLLSWAVEWEQALNFKLLTPRERGRYYFKYELGGLLRANMQERYQSYQLALQNGIMSRNEVRELEDLNPVDGGELFAISQNVQLLDSSGKPMIPAVSEDISDNIPPENE